MTRLTFLKRLAAALLCGQLALRLGAEVPSKGPDTISGDSVRIIESHYYDSETKSWYHSFYQEGSGVIACRPIPEGCVPRVIVAKI